MSLQPLGRPAPEEYRKIAHEIEQWSTLLKEIEKGKS
jgi:hypothetical protein